MALIQDNLDEGRPAWRLRLSVIGGGLRERGRQARHATAASLTSSAWHNRWGTIMLAGLICGFLAGDLTSPLSAAPRGWQGVALDAVLAAVAVTASSWPTACWPCPRWSVWRACRRADGRRATVAGVAGLVLVSGSHPPAQVNASWAYWADVLATGLAMAAAIGLWAAAATATARHLTLAPRVRAAQLVLGAIIPTAVSTMLITLALWWSATQDSVTMLVLAVANLAAASAGTPVKIRRAVRRGRRLRSAASGR